MTPLPRVTAVEQEAPPPRLPGIVTPISSARAEPPCPDGGPGASVHATAPPDVGAVPPYASVTATGLASCVVRAGVSAVHPTPDDTVAVRYVGWATDGVSFDSSLGRSDTVSFPLRGLIAGWTEGVPLMVVGEIRRFWIPAALAYGNRPGRPSGMLVFDIELVSIGPAP